MATIRAIARHHSRTWSRPFSQMVAAEKLKILIKIWERQQRISVITCNLFTKNKSTRNDTDETDSRALHLRWYREGIWRIATDIMTKPQGQPRDIPGCPCLYTGIQLITLNKDSRTTYSGKVTIQQELSSPRIVQSDVFLDGDFKITKFHYWLQVHLNT